MNDDICGIYQLDNDFNEYTYIGRSKNLHNRWAQHIRELNNETHVNKKLQDDWNKYGAEHFHFRIIEQSTELNYQYREQVNIIKAIDNGKVLYNAPSVKDNIMYRITDYLVEHSMSNFTMDYKTNLCKDKRDLNWNLRLIYNDSKELYLNIYDADKIKEYNKQDDLKHKDNIRKLMLEYKKDKPN